MKYYFTLFFIFWHIYIYAQEWDIIEIGQCPTPDSYDLVLADGQNDGIQRIYVTTKDGGVYEWSFLNGNWQLSNTVHPGPLNNLMHIAAGDVKGDGITRIYFAEWSQSARIYEAVWDGNSFQNNLIGTAPDINTGIVIGDGRNDGKNRIYISGSYGLHEWEWTGSSWSNDPLGNTYHEVSGEVGNARNDGVNRVLMNTNCLKEWTWGNNSFSENDILCPGDSWPDAVQIADGRNDGIQRVYVNTTSDIFGMDAGRWEFTWNGAGWDAENIEPTGHRGDIHLAKLKADGNYRVYTTTSDYWAGPADDLFEYEWNGNNWIKTGTVINAVSGATAMLASGNGRNDDTIRLYTPNYVTGGIYEITFEEPYVMEPTVIGEIKNGLVKVNIFPNPWKADELNVQLFSEKYRGEVFVMLTNYMGQEIWQSKESVLNRKHVFSIDCGHCLPGIYFLKIEDGGGDGGLYFEKIIRQ